MSRFLTVGVVALVYTAAATLLVRGEGERYRESLRQGLALAGPEASPGPQPPQKKATAKKGAFLKKQGGMTKKQAEAARQAEIERRRAEAERQARIARKKAAAKAADEASRAPGAPIPMPRVATAPPFQEVDNAWANGLDLANLSAADEDRLGGYLSQIISSFHHEYDGGGLKRRISSAASPILETCARPEVNYKFIVLDSDAVSAFSHPGGYVYVCRGLFSLIGADNAALSYVIGHEIAHVDLKHALTMIAAVRAKADPKGSAAAGDALKEILATITVGFPDAEEFAADDWIGKRMVEKLGYRPFATLTFLRRFDLYAENNGFFDGRKHNTLLSPVENHFRMQPAANKRYLRLKKQLSPGE